MKREGQITIVVPMYLLLFLIVMIAYFVQLYQYEAIKTYTEDALAASNLASAVIDIQEYGISHDILIASPDEAYDIYQTSLKINMGLSDEWTSNNIYAISGPVEILDYIIYNVKGPDIYIYVYGQNEYDTLVEDGLGSVEAPNGQIIESTSIYSRITFPVNGIFDIQTVAEKDLLVDVVENR